MKENEILIGIIIDVSASMKENWHNPSKKNIPKIEFLTQELNKYLKKLSISDSKKNIKIFCIGLGVSITESISIFEIKGKGEEKETTGSKQLSMHSHVIDFLTLGKSLPKQEIIEDLQKDLNYLWEEYARELLSEIKIDTNAKNDLIMALSDDIYEDTKKHYRYKKLLKTNNKIIKKIISKIDKSLRFSINDEQLMLSANRTINHILNNVEKHSKKLFNDNNSNYKEIIENNIESFAKAELKLILNRQSLGFSKNLILNKFDKRKMQFLQKKIYDLIKKDFEKNFKKTWVKASWHLFKSRLFLKLTIESQEHIKKAVESYVHYIGWTTLKTHVENKVKGVFEHTFKNELKSLLKKCIDKSIHFHTVEELSSLKTLLPSMNGSLNKDFENILFGSCTPINRAIDFASLHFNNKKYINYKKYLLIFSDGDFEDENKEYIETTDLLKGEKVTIGGLLISQKNIVRKIGDIVGVGNKYENFTNLCSQIKNVEKLKIHFKNKNINISDQNRLIFQVNSSENFEPILDFILNQE